MSVLDELHTELERAEHLKSLLVARAIGTPQSDADYKLLRRALMGDSGTAELLPAWVKTNRDLAQFWQFIQGSFKRYKERREFIWNEFAPLLDHLEGRHSKPADAEISNALRSCDPEGVHEVWQKALERRERDPDGALTAARSLLETVCKHILDEADIVYEPDKIELPELYKLVAKQLNLAPSDHTEAIFKQILGGVASVVHGLGAARNRLGDAHGQTKAAARPAARHAALAVNLAGAVALFLVETSQARKRLPEP